MILGLVIDGNRNPTMGDVDDRIERMGSIARAFAGVRVEEGAVGQIPKVNGFHQTKKVAYGMGFDGREVSLIVMDYHNPNHYVWFYADLKGGQLRSTNCPPMFSDERVARIRNAIMKSKVQCAAEARSKELQRARAERSEELQRLRAMQSDIEHLRMELDRHHRAQADQRAQDWCVMSNAAVLMATLYMAAAYLM
jgi:hypothetical protein